MFDDLPCVPLIPMMMDEARNDGMGWVAETDGFAFTFGLPAVPDVHEFVTYAHRRFRVVAREWHPHEPFAVRLLVIEDGGKP